MYPHSRLLCSNNYTGMRLVKLYREYNDWSLRINLLCFRAGKLIELWSNTSRFIHQMNVKNILKTPLVCGQPTEETHPHLVGNGEVSIEMYKSRYEI